MTASHPHSIAARTLAALAVALTFILAGGTAAPASADQKQWVWNQPHWSGQSDGWRHHNQWRNQWHHRRHFNNGFNGCFNCGRPVIVFNGGGAFFASPGFVVGNPGFFASPGFVVGNPGFIVNQGHFIVGQPGFVVRRPNIIFARPEFAARQRAFFNRHPSLQLGQPMHHKPWIHNRPWNNPMPMGQPGIRIIRPGMN
jgi:hypothetical protein